MPVDGLTPPPAAPVLGASRRRRARTQAMRQAEPCSRAGELLDTVVVLVGDVDVPDRVGRHTEGVLVQGMRELSVPRAVTPPGSEEVAVRIELLDVDVVGVRDVDAAARVGRLGGGEALPRNRAFAGPGTRV